MAAMVTKFAVAVAGRHAHAPGLLPDVVDEERGRAGDNGVTEPEEGEPPSREAGNTASSSNDQADAAPRVDIAERRPSFTDVKNHPAAKWLKDFSRGASQRSAWTYEDVVSDMEAEEKKAYYVKVSTLGCPWRPCLIRVASSSPLPGYCSSCSGRYVNYVVHRDILIHSAYMQVGSGIFSATEGWPYGSAMYFCRLHLPLYHFSP